MTESKELIRERCLDSIGDHVCMIQDQLVKLTLGEDIDSHKVYRYACEIEFSLNVLRELRK